MKASLIDRLQSKGMLYWRSLMLAIVLTCVPIAVISSAFLYAGNAHLVKQFHNKHQLELNDMANQVDEQFSQLVTFVSHMAVKPQFRSTIADMNFVDRFEETEQILSTLSVLENAVPLIDQVFLYVKKQNKLLHPSLGVRQLEQPEVAGQWSELLDPPPDMYWTHGLARPFGQAGTKHAIVMKLPYNSSADAYGAIVIFINPAKLHVFSLADRQSFIVDANGNIAARTNTSATDERLMQVIRDERLHAGTPPLENQTQDGDVEVKLDGETYLVKTASFNTLGETWSYVSATPLSVITSPTRPYTQFMVLLSCIALAAALFISWFASRRIYNPIRRVIEMVSSWRTPENGIRNELDYIEQEWKEYHFANESLQEQWNLAIPSMRAAYITQFMQGQAITMEEAEIKEKLRSLALDIDGRRFASVVVQLHNAEETRTPMSDKDMHLLTYASINVVQELSMEEAECGHVHVMNFLDGSFGLVLFMESEGGLEDSHRRILALGDRVMRALHHTLRVYVTIVASRVTDRWLDLPHAMEQARRAISYRNFGLGNQLLEAEHVLAHSPNPVESPVDLELGIVHALSMGLEEEAMESLERFVNALQAGGGAEWMVHEGLMRLIGSIHRSMLQLGHNPYAVFGSSWQEELSGLRDTRATLSWFRTKIVQPYITSLKRSYNAPMKQAAEALLERIQQDYMCDLSLDMCAAEAGISASQLSRAFKQMTGQNFIDYLTMVKMNKCKELLLATDMKINEIAESVGYQPPYFNRLFKKQEGMTPGQYRQQHSKQRQQHSRTHA
ncbi:AraC family transcriptional regulator [Paenibacillus apiarius]|uniref:AraC family transcriptional regulator n=1 Tax=Paenibacillus apiarius TaxID=46240 RepID=A0ABT4DX90_9BACL|nr:AraC family transcriptional regulator [Paenibacillus apiarius]MCY9515691.1 AraC family transcriptional regulator [Paenibacillus apiarius]MCY9521976.1 AraC family transcriptional regulator [Paenibacillus apiarius]MCY9550522.1 AraC family transcriptional regulator [Paenibacillus apiarius]MCY9559829.1 AraC family transcriptional regulator [Paenibacillus apiarius]MCY9683487.1 AraC family transcriptional regulator [Paenibacillus apiarius]